MGLTFEQKQNKIGALIEEKVEALSITPIGGKMFEVIGKKEESEIFFVSTKDEIEKNLEGIEQCLIVSAFQEAIKHESKVLITIKRGGA